MYNLLVFQFLLFSVMPPKRTSKPKVNDGSSDGGIMQVELGDLLG